MDPRASPLLFQLELVAAYAKDELTGSGFIVSYSPYRGTGAGLTFFTPRGTTARSPTLVDRSKVPRSPCCLPSLLAGADWPWCGNRGTQAELRRRPSDHHSLASEETGAGQSSLGPSQAGPGGPRN
jgi:hypothetical protein